MWKLDKTREELQEFWKEVAVENRPRYNNPKEWMHLWVDFWVSLFSMSYTIGHLVGLGLPICLLLSLYL